MRLDDPASFIFAIIVGIAVTGFIVSFFEDLNK